ncbi:hypothetical protein AVEN_44280-1 [Araneus ventricosus]|uniref:BTB domain-containing protein n=1 Tax=Araneus ventricosus TaxID=182803 RepID=A0A4Y2RZU1_ARAVE|nr:hypothetical protein AVEN_44280-1 [Araneus ventricosus]
MWIKKCSRYTTTLNVFFQQYLNVKTAKSAPTALDALEENYRTQSSVDVSVKTKTKTYPAHKAILCARSPKFKSIIGKNSREINFQYFGNSDNCEHLFLFLYTDTLEISSLTNVLELYILSIYIDLELLIIQCRKILSGNLHNLCPALMLGLSVLYQDSLFETTVEKYVMTHYDIVLSETNWEKYADKPELRKEIILLKYKKQKTTPSVLHRRLAIAKLL